MSFCEVLKDLRAERGVTQKEIALACGITPTCICQLENGSRNPTGSTLRELAKYFGCSSDYLLELDNFEGNGTSAYSPTVAPLSSEESNLLALFGKMTQAQKIRFLSYGEGLLDAEAPAKKA